MIFAACFSHHQALQEDQFRHESLICAAAAKDGATDHPLRCHKGKMQPLKCILEAYSSVDFRAGDYWLLMRMDVPQAPASGHPPGHPSAAGGAF